MKLKTIEYRGGKANDIRSLDLSDACIILIRRGCRIDPRNITCHGMDDQKVQKVMILIVDDIWDIRAIDEEVMRKAGFVRGVEGR